MSSKTTKSIASRIPVDLYLKLQKEAEILGLNMKDYLLKIIIERNKKKTSKDAMAAKEKNTTQPKQPKEKTKKINIAGSEILFPE